MSVCLSVCVSVCLSEAQNCPSELNSPKNCMQDIPETGEFTTNKSNCPSESNFVTKFCHLHNHIFVALHNIITFLWRSTITFLSRDHNPFLSRSTITFLSPTMPIITLNRDTIQTCLLWQYPSITFSNNKLSYINNQV